MNVLDKYLGLNSAALQVRNQRLEVIAENIANASTPNYKAKDINFAKAMAMANGDSGNVVLTHVAHQDDAGLVSGKISEAVVYRIPLAPSLDNNTVEMSVEQANYAKAAANYQASLQFIENRISGVRKALRGD
jgi:flagellar basal-body rod protein FlgB